MLCYRDRTFCSFSSDCIFGWECPRALTDAIAKDAERVGLDICSFVNKPSCWEPISQEEKIEKE